MTKMELIESETLAAILDRLDVINRRLEAVDMTPKAEWLTPTQYAAKMGKSADTVRRWIRQGAVETKREGKARLILFNPAE